jgi:4-amino-4-deoxy-L-arabinose transferase-like glycosyltransferase
VLRGGDAAVNVRITKERVTGFVLALATVVVVTCNGRRIGIARDEVVYFGAGDRYAAWWIGLVTFDHGVSAQSITDAFGGKQITDNNSEHPPLMKTLSGLSHRIVHDKLGLTDELTAYRLPAAVVHGALVLCVYAMTLELWGFASAVIAALLLLLLPRALFHAGLACFDAPSAALWFVTVYAYWRCLDGRKWPWQVGVAWGLALATKHTALFLPFALAVHYAIVGFRAGRWRGLVAHRWRVIVSLVVLGPLVFVALWPWLWFDTYAHVRNWLEFHATHVHYNYEYLGANWNAPRFPWHVALVTTLYTVPTATVAAAIAGAGAWIARWRRGDAVDKARAPALLLGLSAAASIGPFFLGTTPIFGAEKHWMPALPTLAIAAGVGAVWAARLACEVVPKLAARVAIPIVGGALVLAAAVETITAEPYALTWYDALAGGAPGGADSGMNRQFWGVAARGVLPVLDARAPAANEPPRRVYSHDASMAFGWYRRLGLVSDKLVDSGSEYSGGIEGSTLALVVHELHFNRHDYLIWKAYGTLRPIYVLRSDGVPIVTVYEKPEPRR